MRRDRMSIDFYFCEFFNSDPIVETNDSNINLVNEVIKAFPGNESDILKNQNILIFYHCCPEHEI